MRTLFPILVLALFSFQTAWAEDASKVQVDLDQLNSEIKKESDVETPKEEEFTGRKIERVEVTGSHIKRIDVEGPSPVLTIDQEDLVRSGYNSVSDVLRDTGVNSFGSFREHAGQIGAGTAAVDLRGLGQVRTLILLNGKRLPTDATGGAVDLNIIPMGAVQRVEILKDGASAIYGSDALGGVVNIITKKDFDGHELGTSFSVTEQRGGERRDFSYTYGYDEGRFRMINVLFMRHNERIQSKDREWSKVGLSSYGSPGTYVKNGKNFAADDCPADMIRPDGRCGYNFGEENWEMPYVKQGSLMNQMSYELSDSLTAISRVTYSYKETDWAFAPAFSDKLTMEDPNAPGETINLRYRFRELGNRESNTRTNAGMVLLGLQGMVGDTWDWESSLSFNKVDRKERRTGYALTADIQNAIDNGQYNPLAPEGERGDISQLGYDPQQNSVSENTFLETKASGEVGEWGAGPIMMAVGTQVFRELYRDGADDRTLNGEVLSIASSAGGGARNSASVFTEMSLQPLETMEAVSALRMDYFEGFGSTVNPKLGFRYRPVKELMFRASAGTGFKAPQMQKLYATQTTGRSTFVDQVHCNKSGGAACDPTQKPVVIGGNRNLNEERSFSFNVGSVVQPNKKHSFGVDFWYYDLKDMVEETDFGAVTRAEAAGQNIAKYGAVAERDPVTGELIGDGLYAPYLNISSTETQGLDFNYNGKFLTGIGDFKVRFQHSHMIYYKTEPFPGTGITDRIGFNGRPQWRNNTTVFYIPHPNHEISVLGRTIGSNSKVVRSAGRYPTYTEYDLRYSWAVTSIEGKLTFGISNLLGSMPPFDDSVPSDPDINFRLYDERGRSAFLSYRQIF